MFPSSRAADSSPFDFILLSLNVMHVQIQREGGGGVGGPDPIPGKSQVLSNSIEISILTPFVNSWTPPRIPGKFWTKKTQNKHKKNQSCLAVFSPLGLDPPLRDKKSGSAHALTIQQLNPPPPPPRAHPMSEGTIWLCLYLG